MNSNQYITNYFLFLFSIIPVTMIIGSAVSVFNILLIDLSFIIVIVFRKDFSFLKSKPIIYLLVLYAYLIFNSFISLDLSNGLLRNFGFLRMIILFAAFNYFFLDEKFYRKIFKFWMLTFIIVLIDVFIENFTGKNILGFGNEYYPRAVSFFKDEQIVGSFLNGFYLILAGFLFNELKKKNLLYVFALIFIFIIAIIFTGERSTSIKAFFGLTFFLFFLKVVDLKKRIALMLALIVFLIFSLLNSHFLQIRYINQIKTAITKISSGPGQSTYFGLYTSGLEVFKNHKIFGVGNKNYRVETCENKKDFGPTGKTRKYYCSTHPHQIYFELLSEHGIIGTFIIIFVLFKLVFFKVFNVMRTSNYLKLGSFIYMMLVFTPLLPSGAFFNNFLLTIFMINLSIFYALDKSSNIFRHENNR